MPCEFSDILHMQWGRKKKKKWRRQKMHPLALWQ